MLRYGYYPFENSIENINSQDLMLLKDIAEGWYVDYKVEGLKIVDYAKHLSAFANQYGGWLIIGVSEKDDGSRTADAFPGVDNNKVEKISREIREAAAAHSNPEILYEEHILKGPIKEVSLEKGKSVIIIGIPRSLNTPHVHSSGRIYRRLADHSKPKEETDRFILDDLWKRGADHQQKISTLLTQIPSMPDSQSKSAWAHVFFRPSEYQLPPQKALSFDNFVKIVKNSDNSVHGVHAPMQAINTTSYGFVGRQIEGNDPSQAALSIHWFHDGSARLDIPLNTYDYSTFLETHQKNTYAEEYCSLACNAGYKHMKIVDYSIFVQMIASLSNCYLHMRNIIEDQRDIYSCFTLRNLFQTSSYVDSEVFIDRIKKFSLPFVMEENIVIPEEPTIENMIFHSTKSTLKNPSTSEDKQTRPYVFSFPIIYKVFNSVGLFSDYEAFIKDQESWGFNKVNNLPTNP